MEFTAVQISKIVNGKIEGDSNEVVTSFAKIEEACENQMTFLANLKYEEHLYTTHASIILLNDNYQLKQPVTPAIIRVADPYAAFVTLLSTYKEMINHQMNGIQQPCYISSTARLGENVFIGAFSYLGENVKIGNNTKIYPNTYIGDAVQIGNDCVIHAGVRIYFECILKNNIIIHSGTVIGSDGFGYAPQKDGTVKKIPQIGNVLIEDNAEIGANTTIDRATLGSTIIKHGVKLDNLIQIAHNVEIGSNAIIAAQSGISGSTKIGNNVMIGGQAGIVDHIQIADGVKIGAQSGVQKSIKVPDTMVVGSPASEYISALRGLAIIPNLPDLKKRIMELEQLVQQLLAEKVSH